MSDADDVIREALLKGLPIDSRRRALSPPAESPPRDDQDPAPALSAPDDLDDPHHDAPEVQIETLAFVDGRLSLVVDHAATKGRTDERTGERSEDGRHQDRIAGPGEDH